MAASNKLVILFETYGKAAAKVVVMVAAALLDPSHATIDSIRAAIAAITSGRTKGASISKKTPSGLTGQTFGTGAYNSVADKAVLVFRDNAGGTHPLAIPAPKEAMFESGTMDKVNPDAEAVDAAITEIMTWESRDASNLGTYVSGARRRRMSKGN